MASNALPTTQLAGMLSAWSSAMSTPLIFLDTSGTVPGPNTTLSQVVPPTASWYSPSAATFGAVYSLPDDSVSVTAESAQFTYSGSDAATIVTGYGVMDTAATTLYMMALLPNPVTLQNTLDSLIVQPTVNLPSVPQS